MKRWGVWGSILVVLCLAAELLFLNRPRTISFFLFVWLVFLCFVFAFFKMYFLMRYLLFTIFHKFHLYKIILLLFL